MVAFPVTGYVGLVNHVNDVNNVNSPVFAGAAIAIGRSCFVEGVCPKRQAVGPPPDRREGIPRRGGEHVAVQCQSIANRGITRRPRNSTRTVRA